MSRPITHDDLPDYARRGHSVAVIPSDFITRHPSLGQHLLAALAEADRLGLQVSTSGEITIPLTTDELDSALKDAQYSWDYHQRDYDKYLTGEPLEQWRRSGLTHWAQAEGLDLPVWDDPIVAAVTR